MAESDMALTDSPLRLDPSDARLIELDQLRTEVARLRPIADNARYVWGTDVCIGEDRECEDYTDADGNDRPDVLLCSHAELRHAHRVDAILRERYEYLITNLLDLLEHPPADVLAELADLIETGVLSAAGALDEEDPRGDRLPRGDLVTRVVDAHRAQCREDLARWAQERIPTTLAGFKPYYGVQLSVIDDNAATAMVALGHHDDRLTVAALLACARVHGIRYEVGQVPGGVAAIERTWARQEGECGNCPDGDLRNWCSRCAEIRGGGWWLTWGSNVRPFAEGAFPVTVLSLD